MGTSQDRLLSLLDNFWEDRDKLPISYVDMLDKSFTENEVRDIVFACNPSKAPGPYDFSFLFYQTYWEIVKIDAMKLVHAFYYNILDIFKINLASIYLIPKKRMLMYLSNIDL
jgi:hypothetical protein